MITERDVLNEDLERMWFYGLEMRLAVCVCDYVKERVSDVKMCPSSVLCIYSNQGLILHSR